MIRICRAEDGQAFQVNATIRDVERLGSLELFIRQETGIEEDAVLAYLSDGRRLTSPNLRDLVGAQDQTIFVFNKFYLEDEVDEVVQKLLVTPKLEPPIEDIISSTPPLRSTSLDAFLRSAKTHLDFVLLTHASLHNQHESILVASTALNLHVLAIVDPFDAISANCQRELEKQSQLLAGVDTDLELIAHVKIHTEFMSPGVRRAVLENGERHRTLGDYVAAAKMRQVANTCTRTHGELMYRYNQVEQAVTRLRKGAESVHQAINQSKMLDDAETCRRNAQDARDRIVERASAIQAQIQAGVAGADIDHIPELKKLDATIRKEVQFIAELKNSHTHTLLTLLRRISILNTDMVQLPPLMADLQTSFRAKNSFSHIQRLHNMMYAYGATVVEIVRRKEFARFFWQRAQSILEVMAKLSTNERKRRQVYRGELEGQLPFEIRGMDDPVPNFDAVGSSNKGDSSYALERTDVEEILRLFEDLERLAASQNQMVAVAVLRDCITQVDKLVQRMDNLETSFDRIVEKSLLSASRLDTSRRRSIEADEQMYHELTEQLRASEAARQALETQLHDERASTQAEIERLRSALFEKDANAESGNDHIGRLERELEVEKSTRAAVEERNAAMVGELENHSRATEHLRQELAQTKAEFEDVKALEARHADKVQHLLEEQSKNLAILEEARSRGENLESQIGKLRRENEEVNDALRDASVEKDRLLRAQSTEHERVIRDHIAEADGDRAVLERQFFELKVVLEKTERQVRGLQTELEITKARLNEEEGKTHNRTRESAVAGVRVEEGDGEAVDKMRRDLKEARLAERLLRDDLKAGRASATDYEQKLEEQIRLVAQLLDVAISFHASHVKALATAHAVTLHFGINRPATGGAAPTAGTSAAEKGAASTTALGTPPLGNLMDSIFVSNSLRQSTLLAHPTGPTDEQQSLLTTIPIDASDPASALDILRSFDHDHFLEAVGKTAATVRKWQKQCREYRERAKGKISFRNFAKGDLALFLPTRNSVQKPWAAFNVSFPHYFLQATGHLAEQLKTREWIVARITSITEKVVNNKDPLSNPYGLGDGIKYYMLEVEDWTQPAQNKRRTSSRKVSNEKDGTLGHGLGPSLTAAGENNASTISTGRDPQRLLLSNSTPTLPPGPPEAEVEETFRVTHPPNSQYFPVRTRSNSSPGARPSSLSRLLAQASPTDDDVFGQAQEQQVKQGQQGQYERGRAHDVALSQQQQQQQQQAQELQEKTAPSSPTRGHIVESQVQTNAKDDLNAISRTHSHSQSVTTIAPIPIPVSHTGATASSISMSSLPSAAYTTQPPGSLPEPTQQPPPPPHLSPRARVQPPFELTGEYFPAASSSQNDRDSQAFKTSSSPAAPTSVSPSLHVSSLPPGTHAGGSSSPSVPPSPFRPGSRASRRSVVIVSSKPPRLPVIASSAAKAIATTALAEELVISSPSEADENNSSKDNDPFVTPVTPVDESGTSAAGGSGVGVTNAGVAGAGAAGLPGSMGSGSGAAGRAGRGTSPSPSRVSIFGGGGGGGPDSDRASIFRGERNRKRTASYHVPRPSPLALTDPVSGEITMHTATASATPTSGGSVRLGSTAASLATVANVVSVAATATATSASASATAPPASTPPSAPAFASANAVAESHTPRAPNAGGSATITSRPTLRATTTLAQLAQSWGMPFGRTRTSIAAASGAGTGTGTGLDTDATLTQTQTRTTSNEQQREQATSQFSAASDLLKRF